MQISLTEVCIHVFFGKVLCGLNRTLLQVWRFEVWFQKVRKICISLKDFRGILSLLLQANAYCGGLNDNSPYWLIYWNVRSQLGKCMRRFRRCGFVGLVLALLKEVYLLEGSLSLVVSFEFSKAHPSHFCSYHCCYKTKFRTKHL